MDHVSADSVRVPTAQRILQAALAMFNENGVDRVPLYKIAAQVGISQGNLTYHYPLKKDLIYELVRNLEHEITAILSIRRESTPKGMASYLTGLFEVMWRYHFFFTSLTYIVRTDDTIAETYERITRKAQAGSMARIEDAVATGDIPSVVFPNSPRILAENMWAVWINRLGLGRSEPQAGTAAEAVYDCCLHHLSLIQPYAQDRWLRKLHSEIKSSLGM